MITYNESFYIPSDKILSMKRGRFIPLLFKLAMNPSSCDAVAHNNNKEFNMRVLENAPSADFIVEILPNTLKLERKNINKERVKFEIQVRIRNLSTSATGGPPAVINDVWCHWELRTTGRVDGWDQFKVARVTSNWSTFTISKTVDVPRNAWRPRTFKITVDRSGKFFDPNRDNNIASLEFRVPE
jgi:hypothetical protein